MHLLKDRTSLIVYALLFASAIAPLFFRFFITLDGPVHVLHASILEQYWTTPRYVADGIVYNTDYIDVQIGDLLLIALMRAMGPETAHDLFAVIVTLCLMAAALFYMRAQAVRINTAALWLAPLCFSFLLIMGFFHFLLGVALCLGVAAWWRTTALTGWRRWIGLAVGVGLAWSAHRSAPMLLAALFITGELSSYWEAPSRERSRGWRSVMTWAAMAVVIAVALFALREVSIHSAVDGQIREKEYRHLFILRSFLLLGYNEERWLLLAFAVLLGASVVGGMVVRWRLGKRFLPDDALFLLALAFSVVPLLHETRKTLLLFVVERSHWLALLFLILWLVAMQSAGSGWARHVITVCALLTAPLQAGRLIQTGTAMAELEELHDKAVEAGTHLGSGNTVVPIIAETNWLLQHLGAYVAVRHDGIFFTRKEHLHFVFADPPIPEVKLYLKRMTADRWWLPKHWLSGNRPVMDRIIFVGHDARERALWLEPWQKMLDRRYIVGFDNGYCTVYAVDRWGKKEEERRR